MILRYTAVLFLCLSGVLCELGRHRASTVESLRYVGIAKLKSAAWAVMVPSPLEDLPACSWMPWHCTSCIVSGGAVSCRVQDRAWNALGSWFAKCGFGFSVEGACQKVSVCGQLRSSFPFLSLYYCSC